MNKRQVEPTLSVIPKRPKHITIREETACRRMVIARPLVCRYVCMCMAQVARVLVILYFRCW